MDLHLNLKFAGRSISFRPKSFEPVPSGTALIPLLAPSSPVESLLAPSSPVESLLAPSSPVESLLAPYSPVMSRLTLRRSESEIVHQQSQLPTASFWKLPTGKKSSKHCKPTDSVMLPDSICAYSDEKQDQILFTKEAFEPLDVEYSRKYIITD